MKRIEDELGQTVSLAEFFQDPTVEGLAEQLRGQRARRPWSPLVTMQRRGRGRPFFCVHPALGSVARYDAIARHMGDERPFHALCSIGLEPHQVPDTRVEDMASRYVAAVRAQQPEGPYLLGGHSFGGLVAFEMAQQLWRSGERVELVALLDTGAPGIHALAGGGESADERDALIWLTLLRDADLPVAHYAELRRLAPDARLERFLELLRAASRIPAGYDLEQVRRMVAWRARIVPDAYLEYKPRVYPGKLLLLRAAEPVLALEERSKRASGAIIDGLAAPDVDPFHGWHALSSQPLAVERVPGDHFSMLRPPHVAALAARLGACLVATDGATTDQAGRIVAGG
jgi:thioesterase domain-containing protein